MKKVIVITGASSGFGALMAETFAAAGHQVIATARNIKGKNADATNRLSAIENIEVEELDVTSDSSVETAIANILKKHSRIDVLINNAGIYGAGLLEGYSVDQFTRIFEVNVFGVLRVNNAVLPAMRSAKDGLIINISSGLGRISPPFSVPYNASKFALEGIVEGSYMELIGQGIENILIEPGAYPTTLWSQPGVHADREEVLSHYGEATQQMIQGFGGIFEAAISKAQPDPQVVADAALELINTEKGKRPLRTPLDLVSNGIDKEYDKATTEIKGRIFAAYGF